MNVYKNLQLTGPLKSPKMMTNSTIPHEITTKTKETSKTVLDSWQDPTNAMYEDNFDGQLYE